MSSIDIFQEEFPSLESYWRSVILFGKNTSSYKFALSKSLLDFATMNNSRVSLEDLAEKYSFYMCEHTKNTIKQTTCRTSGFIDACDKFNKTEITKEELINITIKQGLNYVFDAFHIVNDKKIPLKFFEKEFSRNSKKLILTDELFKLKEIEYFENLRNETEARWNLVETAWDLGINQNILSIKYDENDNSLFIDKYLKRKNITSARSALNGYQKGKCFYCFRDINILEGISNFCDVDHFFPHSLKQQIPYANIDGVWNLVLACPYCNRGTSGKFAKVPSIKYLTRLYKRNEFLISSHHPLRETLMLQMGKTEDERKEFIKKVDKIAINHLIHRWETKPMNSEVF